MAEAGINLRRWHEEVRGIDPETLDDLGEVHGDNPQAHARALGELSMYASYAEEAEQDARAMVENASQITYCGDTLRPRQDCPGDCCRYAPENQAKRRKEWATRRQRSAGSS